MAIAKSVLLLISNMKYLEFDKNLFSTLCICMCTTSASVTFHVDKISNENINFNELEKSILSV